MRVLFVHQGFPGQFTHLSKYLTEQGHMVSAVCPFKKEGARQYGVEYHFYSLKRGNTSFQHPLIIETESKVIRGEAVAHLCSELERKGYTPDIVIAHAGWGETLFLKKIWPEIPHLHYVEYAYGAKDSDYGFLDKYSPKPELTVSMKTILKNANTLLNLDHMDWGITPTRFQLSTIPTWAHHKISVIHEGIDTSWATPEAQASFTLPNGVSISKKHKVITFVNRTFEPYRGIHVFLESLQYVFQIHPDCFVLLVGKDTPHVSYGAHRSDGQGWVSYLKSQLKSSVDWNRVFVLGKVAHEDLRTIFRISTAHVYLTYPFVLSWSLLEAMSCGCVVIGSQTSPVTEVIRDNENGLLVPFDKPKEIASKISSVLSNAGAYDTLRLKARETIIECFDTRKCLDKQVSLIMALVNNVIAGGSI